ncbi:hypothetical protein J7K41_03470 [Candidatus Micrarchaeota archaeon]|nr:hypothetical protein [Candidatus Micrarchaeota archaeon]
MIPVFAYVVSIIGALISGAAATLAYIISYGMKYPSMQSWARTEFKEFVKTVLIIAFSMFILVRIVSQLINALTGLPSTPGDPLYFNAAETFLRQQYIDTLVTNRDLMTHQAVLGAYSDMKISVGAVFGGGVKPFKTLALPASTLSTAIDYGMVTSLAFLSMLAILELFKDVAFTVIFPMGIIFRAFPFSRKLGSSLIALAIAGYFVLPVTILFDQWLYQNFNWADVTYLSERPPYYAESGSNFYLTFKDQVIDLCSDLISPTPLFEEVYDQLNGLQNDIENHLESNLGGVLGGALSIVTKLFFTVLKIPLKIVTGTIDLVMDVISGTYGVYQALRIVAVPLTKVVVDMINGDYARTSEVMESSFDYTVDVIAYSANRLMFALLCILIDWVLVETFFVSLSDALGGEKSLLGLGRLRKLV